MWTGLIWVTPAIKFSGGLFFLSNYIKTWYLDHLNSCQLFFTLVLSLSIKASSISANCSCRNTWLSWDCGASSCWMGNGVYCAKPDVLPGCHFRFVRPWNHAKKKNVQTIKEEENFLFGAREKCKDIFSFSYDLCNFQREALLQEADQVLGFQQNLVTLDKLLELLRTRIANALLLITVTAKSFFRN